MSWRPERGWNGGETRVEQPENNYLMERERRVNTKKVGRIERNLLTSRGVNTLYVLMLCELTFDRIAEASQAASQKRVVMCSDSVFVAVDSDGRNHLYSITQCGGRYGI